MILVGKETNASGAQVLQRAIAYFGPTGLGLELTRKDDASVQLQGGGGYVAVRVRTVQESESTDVEIESQEWEFDAQQFLGKI